MTVQTISPVLTQQAIDHAWQLLQDGATLENLRRSWNQLVALRRDLDATVVAVAREIERLLIEARAAEAKAKAEADAKAEAEAKAKAAKAEAEAKAKASEPPKTATQEGERR
jgi:hypothetical protein